MAMRNVGVAVDFSPCSKAALRWASTNLVRSGDRLVLVYVNTNYQIEQGVIHLWEQNGSRALVLSVRLSLKVAVSGLNLFAVVMIFLASIFQLSYL